MEKNRKKTNRKAYFSTVSIIIGLFLAIGVQASDISKSRIVSLVNESRSEVGLPALTESDTLGVAAQKKAQDMFQNNYFAHTSPSGKDPWHWYGEAGYDYEFAGENLAINYNNAEDQHNAWMKSETHKKNILGVNYSEIGIAVLEGEIDGKKKIVTVQLFGRPIVVVAKGGDAVPVNVESSALVGKSVLAESALNSKSLPQIKSQIPVSSYIEDQMKILNAWLLLVVIIFSLVLIANPLILFIFSYKEMLKGKEEVSKLFNGKDGSFDSNSVSKSKKYLQGYGSG